MLIAKANKSLKNKPAGTLQVYRNKSSYQYYYRSTPNVKNGTYISKKRMPFIRALAQKSYDQKFLTAAETLRKDILAFPDRYCIPQGMHAFYQLLAAVYENLTPARQELVTPYVLPDDMFIQSWLAVEYVGKPFDPDDPELYTNRGERVRSKSEKMIADKLLDLQIPYRYEYPIYIRRLGTVHPDFMMLDILTRENVMFEHFGRMHEARYVNKTLTKLEAYEEDGWHLGDNFLFTMESSDHIINLTHFEKMIRRRFPYISS